MLSIYGSENWILSRENKRKIKGSKIRILRVMTGVPLLEHRSSEDIKKELGISNINEQKINKEKSLVED